MSKIEVDISALAKFTPSEGGRPLLSRNGIFKTKMVGIEFGTAKESGNKTMVITHEVLPLFGEADADTGATLEKTIAVTGKAQKGRNAGEDNILQLGALLASAGRDTDAIRKLAERGTLDLEQIKSSLLAEGKNTSYVACNARAFGGRISSEISGYIPTPRAEDTIAKGRAAQAYNLEQLQALANKQNAGGASSSGATANGVHKASAATSATEFEGQI